MNCFVFSINLLIQPYFVNIGNISSNAMDVGRFGDEDRCCREHDYCSDTLIPGECRRGLCNKSKITRSHCDCDARLRRCLQNVKTGMVNGYLIFVEKCVIFFLVV